MKTRITGRSRKFLPVSIIALSLAMGAPANAADIVKGLFGAILGGIAVANAKKSWEEVPPPTRDCLASRYRIDVSKLADEGIGANDRRLTGQLASCRAQVAAEEERRVQAENERVAREAAQQERLAAEERERVARAEAERVAAEEAQRQAAAYEKAQKAAADAKRKEMTTKYGAQMATLILAGKVAKGMTKEQVMAARGEPNKKDIIQPSDELWHYGRDQIVFTAGKVSYVEQGLY